MPARSGRSRSILLAATLAAAAASAAAQPQHTPPIFTPNPSAGWFIPSREWLPPASGPGPVRAHPDHPLVSNDDYRATGKQPAFPVGDPDAPILLPWARNRILAHNAIVLAGRPAWSLHATCRPMGIPNFLLVPQTRPMFIVQGRDKVVMILSSFADVRRIHLNAAHARGAKPSWHGDSVGHYEGDTLVVDTIGLNDRAPVDGFGTPHTEQLRVVERWRLTDGGETLEVKLYVEDPGAFTAPWTALARYSRSEGIARRVPLSSVAILSSPGEGPLLEAICAENPNSIAGSDAPPVVQSTVPDF
jgi:hypothetical protein